MKRFTTRLFSVVFLAFLVSNGASAQTPPILYVAIDGSGDYNCDGNQDQVEINAALDYVADHSNFTTVYLKGPGVFTIDEPVLISSDTILTGDPDATVKLKDNTGWWTNNKPVMTQKGRLEWSSWGLPGESITNVEIHGFRIDGGIQQEPTGDTFVPLMHFTYPLNVSVHDMDLRNSYWDIIRMTSPTDGTVINSRVYNNKIYYSGHEGICFVSVNDFEVDHNTIYSTRTNCGIRAKDTDNISIHDNTIGNSLGKFSSGYAGILIENGNAPLLGQAEVFNNLIYGKNGGIHLGSISCVTAYPLDSRKDVHIHHNRIYKMADITTAGYNESLDGGIKINGFHNTLIEYNVIEGGTTDGIVYEGTAGGDSGYRTIVRNNIIINNNGYGINNKESSVHSFVSSYNLIYGNTGGDYNETFRNNDISEDPLFAKPHNTFENWHHIVAAYDNTTETFKIFIDGAEQASQRIPGFGQIATNERNLCIGTYETSESNFFFFEGREDEMAIWNRALTSEEVGNLYNDGVPGEISGSLQNGLQACLQMENNWNDSSGNGFNPEEIAARFTEDAIGGNYAGIFDGIDDGVIYPATLSTEHGLTISVWTYRTAWAAVEDTEYQTILNKGSQSGNDHIWLYFHRESVEFELGNGTDRYALEAEIVKPEDLDFHVMSDSGRWDGLQWVQDEQNSPCIDHGDPAADYSNEPSPNGNRVNIGVFGNTSEASKARTGIFEDGFESGDSSAWSFSGQREIALLQSDFLYPS